jgi:5-methyltetrahydrofolate--homocysteine methyltransferase
VEVAKNEGVDIVAMSALLTTTMLAMREVIKALKEAGIREKVKVMIGGAPVTQRYADEIGADGYAPDAASAVEKAKELIGRN